MKSQYETLAEAVRKCSACSFRSSQFQPLFPALPSSPASIMFIGENPSWAGEQDIPFAKSTVSGQALEKYYLKPLGLSRRNVWITDLFKCRYPKSVYRAKTQNEKIIQNAAATCAQLWLLQEIQLVKPKVIVTLADKEVYQRLRRAFGLPIPSKFADAVGRLHPIKLAGLDMKLFPMIHPDISRPIGEGDERKRAAREKWSMVHQQVHIAALKLLIRMETE